MSQPFSLAAATFALIAAAHLQSLRWRCWLRALAAAISANVAAAREKG